MSSTAGQVPHKCGNVQGSTRLGFLHVFHWLILSSRLNDVTNQLTAVQQVLGRLTSDSNAQPSQALLANAIPGPSEPQNTPLSGAQNILDTSDGSFFCRAEQVGNLPSAPISLGQTWIEGSQAEDLLDQFVT